ncbi:MAG: DUF4838 domain-containing protein [Armatimonadota bacterium]
MKTLFCAVVWGIAMALATAAPITLIRDGQCNTAIYVSPEVMAAPAGERMRESVKDLAHYLGAMTGATVPIHTRLPQAGETAVPILIGSYADGVFGPFTMQTDFKQGYRLVVSAKGVGMQGETDEGVSYAIYELLDMLGCRWFLPGAMGEVIPSLKTITLQEIDRRQAPGTVSRSIWYADAAFKRRNRLGGFKYIASHALESYVTKTQLEQHPEWQAVIDGKRGLHQGEVGFFLCLSNPEVSTAVADTIIASLDKQYVPCVSISPSDGARFCECEKCTALDTGDWDDSMACVSITDRYVNFCNRVAARVTQKHPDAKLGFLAYGQYTRPPTREKVHPALIPQLAPITYCRAHTLDDPNCASRRQVRFLLDGWGKATTNMAMYEYYFHLAEVAVPFPMIKRNVVELPVQYKNHVTMWTPETMANFETALPGMYLGIRMAWNTQANPQDILTEFYTRFYGSAAPQMRAYWQYIDDLWTTVPEHAGCGFSYMRRFTPQAMTAARTKINAALAACNTEMETRRVTLADDSLRLHEQFMTLRRDYFAGKFANMEDDVAQWRNMHLALAEKYRENSAFTDAPRVNGEPIGVAYFDWFYRQSYQSLARIGKDFTIVSPPLLSWSFAVDKEKRGEALGWQKANFADKAWKKTDIAIDTWYALGLEAYYGPAWYRTTVKLPALPAGKKVYLWVGATDGACKVFVNGRPASYIDAKGKAKEEASGYCSPFSFDITAAVKANAENQITIVGTRTFLNELGTGGLLGPVLVYRER